VAVRVGQATSPLLSGYSTWNSVSTFCWWWRDQTAQSPPRLALTLMQEGWSYLCSSVKLGWTAGSCQFTPEMGLGAGKLTLSGTARRKWVWRLCHLVMAGRSTGCSEARRELRLMPARARGSAADGSSPGRCQQPGLPIPARAEAAAARPGPASHTPRAGLTPGI